MWPSWWAALTHPQVVRAHAVAALDQLAITWYATGMDRVRDVRRQLADHAALPCVRELDDRLYRWGTTVSALAR